MDIFFSDDFNGSGTMDGHVPEIGFGEDVSWYMAARTTNLVGGYAVNPAYAGSRIVYSADDAGDNPAEFALDFTIVTGPVVAVGDVDYVGFSVLLYLDEDGPSDFLLAELEIDYDVEKWKLTLWDNDGPAASQYITTLLPDTEYAGRITSTGQSQTLTIFGVTLTNPTERALLGGVNRFELTIGGGWKFGQLVGTEYAGGGPPEPEPGVGDAALMAPKAKLAATGGPPRIAEIGTAALVAPSALIEAVGHDSLGDNAFVYAAPAPMLKAFGGANARLAAPRPALALAGKVTTMGRAALAPAAPLLLASGRVSGTGAAALRAPSSRLVGYGGAVCSITVGGATLRASATAGAVGHAALTLPLFELTATGSSGNRGRAELLAPSARLGATAQAWLLAPSARLTAIGSAVVAVSYETYSVNLSHSDPEATHEVTRYTNFPFERIVRFQGSYFGVARDGLYLLEGTTDDGEPIAYAVRTCIDDLKVPQLKTVDAAYFAGRMGAQSTVTLIAGETDAQAYDYTTPRGPGAQNHRQRFGMGVKSRYFALGLSGHDTFELDAIELDVRKLKRRI